MLACSHACVGPEDSNKSRRARRLRGIAAAVALALGAVACGGGGGGGKATVSAAADPTTTTTTVDPGAAFTACLHDRGVDLPARPRPTDDTGATPSSRPPRTDGTGTPPSSRPPGSRPSTSLPAGVDQAKVDAARQACQSLQPDRGAGAGTGVQGQAFQVYASCLKDHGVTLAPGAASRDDPAFKAADAICAPLRPTQPNP